MIENEELVGSTTLKTIKNLRIKKSAKPEETTTENGSQLS